MVRQNFWKNLLIASVCKWLRYREKQCAFYGSHESKYVVTVQRRFCFEYSTLRAPSKDSFKRWYQQFKDTGSVENCRKAPGRPLSFNKMALHHTGVPLFEPSWTKHFLIDGSVVGGVKLNFGLIFCMPQTELM